MLQVYASATDGTREGVVTADGWTLSFDRVVAAVGHIRLTEESCIDYSHAGYTRLFDFTELGREEVGLVYALGTCNVEFDFRPPRRDTLIGTGATEADREGMRLEGSDEFAENQRVALIVQGLAERQGVTKRFDWSFRHRYELDECPRESGEGFVSMVKFRGGQRLELTIEARAQELFREGPYDEAPLHFERFAAADGNNDGVITMAELVAVDAPVFVPDDVEEPPEPPPDTSLAYLVYRRLLPRVFGFAGGGTCQAELEG